MLRNRARVIVVFVGTEITMGQTQLAMKIRVNYYQLKILGSVFKRERGCSSSQGEQGVRGFLAHAINSS